jgi:hypothetical protein
MNFDCGFILCTPVRFFPFFSPIRYNLITTLQGLALRTILPEFLFPPESCLWRKFFVFAEEETLGKRSVPKTKSRTVRPLKQQVARPAEVFPLTNWGLMRMRLKFTV